MYFSIPSILPLCSWGEALSEIRALFDEGSAPGLSLQMILQGSPRTRSNFTLLKWKWLPLLHVPFPLNTIQFSSVAQSCLALCYPTTAAHQASLSITNSWSLLKLMSVELVMPSNHLILCPTFSSCPQSFPASGSFQMSQLFASGGQSIKTVNL